MVRWQGCAADGMQSDGVSQAYLLPCRNTALHLALQRCYPTTALALVEAGADVHCKDKDGYSLRLARDAYACGFGSLVGM